jgi:hypothetical protein
MWVTNGALSKDIKDAGSTLGYYLRTQFPNTKSLQLDYKNRAEDLTVDSRGAQASTVGTAMDLIIRLALSPEETPSSALAMFPNYVPFSDVVHELAGLVSTGANSELQARAAWALAMCVQAFRAGAKFAPYVPHLVLSGDFSVQGMLSEASEEGVSELISLTALARERLIGHLKAPFALGPTFDLSTPGPSQLIAAEADLIASGLLLDVKTTLGAKNKAGERPDALKTDSLYQLLGYSLLDYSNSYEIDRVGIYSARYGTLVHWPLNDVAAAMAGRPVDLVGARLEVWDMMHAV